tara:strand:+ start:4495 stop:6144 length:1650 start_codon:yes stop_codon:yes gene_type:complete
MVEKAEQQASSFNLPKGAPYVPTKVPKLPAATGTTRLESEQKPRQVGVATPLEKAAALTRAKEDSFPALPAEGGGGGGGDQQPDPQLAGLPGTGLPGATLPKPTEAPPTPALPSGGQAPESQDPGWVDPGKQAVLDELKNKGYTTGPTTEDGKQLVLDAQGNVVGYYYQDADGAWQINYGDYGYEASGEAKAQPTPAEKAHSKWVQNAHKQQWTFGDIDEEGKQAVYDSDGNLTGYVYKDQDGNWVYPSGTEPGGQPLETGPGWYDADGNWFDPTDTTAPGYDPEIDPNSDQFNPDKYELVKGQHAAKSASDKAFDDQMDNITESNLVAAAQAKRRLMAQYGQAGMAGSGQFMTAMGKIDIDYQRATNEAHADLMIEKFSQERETDIEFLRQRLELATGEEAEQLQMALTNALLDRDKEAQFLEIFFKTPEYLMDQFGADAFDPDSWEDFMADMKVAEESGKPAAVLEVMHNAKYVDGVLYYRSDWKSTDEGPPFSISWTMAGLTDPPAGAQGLNYAKFKEWLIENGYDPTGTYGLWRKYIEPGGQTVY